MFNLEAAAVSRDMSALMLSDNSRFEKVVGKRIPKSNDAADGLMRFRSVPSSFLAGMMDRGRDSFSPSPLTGGADSFSANDGSERGFSRFMTCNGSGRNGDPDSRPSPFVKPPDVAEKSHRQSSSEGLFSGSNYMPTIAENESWNESSFNCLKRTQEGDLKMLSTFNGIANQNEESRNIVPCLAHHLSLPKTSAQMVANEKYLHFQPAEIVPCKIRAKRGCATHPRSIAERNRRIRISERMRKLHELFPNMDKQTNTADMLDLAVEHIKDLQKQVQTLTDKKANCSCSSKAQPYSHGRS